MVLFIESFFWPKNYLFNPKIKNQISKLHSKIQNYFMFVLVYPSRRTKIFEF